MKKLPVIIFLFCMSFTADDAFRQLQQLSGTWTMKTKKGEINEVWDVESKTLMTGASFLVTKDTLIMERIRLEKQGSDIFYIPTVEDQNNKQPVNFRLVSSTNRKFTFENKTHDFPQRIIYRFVSNDSLIARIEGISRGKFKFSEYYYSRWK